MKHLKDLLNQDNIQEGLKLGSSKINQDSYKEHPKDWDELRNIIENRLKEDLDADLNNIDVSKVTEMSELFVDLDPHNIKIDKWDVSNVTDMSSMFKGCENFEGKGLEKWKLTKLKFASNMFKYCKNFNADLSSWDWRNVWANYAFLGCTKMRDTYFPKWYV